MQRNGHYYDCDCDECSPRIGWKGALLLATAAAALLAYSTWAARAADLPIKAPAAPFNFGPCSQTMCTGPTLGFHITGEGSNADILGSGLNGSVFKDGAGLGIDAGYQFWNGNLFVAAEIGATYYTGTSSFMTQFTGVNPNWSVDYVVKTGYGLHGLFDTSTVSPASGPVTPLQALNGAMITPFVTIGGRKRDGLDGFLAGAGVEYTLGGHSAVNVEYRHINYNKGVDPAGVPVHIGDEQEVRAGYVYKF